MHYMYKITNQINNKVYIGQTIDVGARWSAHKSKAKIENPVQYISRAIAKYGAENFVFETIVICRTQEDADEIESILIYQYDSRDKQFGYNIKPGGNVAPHSEETKQKQSQATFNQIATKGHPAQGTKRTSEQLQTLSKVRKEHPVKYTEEIRKNMSESHIGIKDSEDTKDKKSESAKEA